MEIMKKLYKVFLFLFVMTENEYALQGQIVHEKRQWQRETKKDDERSRALPSYYSVAQMLLIFNANWVRFKEPWTQHTKWMINPLIPLSVVFCPFLKKSSDNPYLKFLDFWWRIPFNFFFNLVYTLWQHFMDTQYKNIILFFA